MTDITKAAGIMEAAMQYQNKMFPRIYPIRRALRAAGYSDTEINELFDFLRVAGVVDFHTGDIASHSADEIRDSYRDENNFLFLTVTTKRMA